VSTYGACRDSRRLEVSTYIIRVSHCHPVGVIGYSKQQIKQAQLKSKGEGEYERKMVGTYGACCDSRRLGTITYIVKGCNSRVFISRRERISKQEYLKSEDEGEYERIRVCANAA
jgi:hypothetical protein